MCIRFFIYLIKIIFWIYSLAMSMSSYVSLLYECYSRVWFEYKPSINLIINETIYFTVFLQIFTPNFDWRSRSRTVALIFNVSRFLYWEFIHCLSIYALYKGFRKPNSEWQDFSRASSDITAMIISLLNSIKCSLVHAHFIYCIFNGVSKLTINKCMHTWYSMRRSAFHFCVFTNFTNISLQHFNSETFMSFFRYLSVAPCSVLITIVFLPCYFYL